MRDSIYKVITSNEWDAAQKAGQFKGSEIDKTDGFIHFSTLNQLEETLEKHFAKQKNLVLLQVDTHLIESNLKWEPARNGEDFPHLYEAMSLEWVRNVFELEVDSRGKHKIPDVIHSK